MANNYHRHGALHIDGIADVASFKGSFIGHKKGKFRMHRRLNAVEFSAFPEMRLNLIQVIA